MIARPETIEAAIKATAAAKYESRYYSKFSCNEDEFVEDKLRIIGILQKRLVEAIRHEQVLQNDK